MESATKKVKWTISNVTENKLMQHDSCNRISSSTFNICLGGVSYEWCLVSYYNEGCIGLFLMMSDPESHKDISISCKMRIGKFSELSWNCNSNALTTKAPLWGWPQLIRIPLLQKFLDDDKNLVFNVEVTLQKPINPKDAENAEFSKVINKICTLNFSQFLYDDEFSDATFTCSDNVKVEVHRVLLIQKSTEFKKVFSDLKKQNLRAYKLDDIDSATMKEILNFAYTGNANLDDIKMTSKLYHAACNYDICELKTQCIDALNKKIDNKTVLDIYEMACQLKLEDVTEKCLKYIMKFYRDLKTSQKWKLLSVELKEKVMDAFAENYFEVVLETNL